MLATLVRQLPTVGLRDDLATAAAARGDAPFVLVVDEHDVVLGKVLARSLARPSSEPVESVMVEGPTTVRAAESLPGLVERLRAARTSSVIVTSNQGELVGVLLIEDAERALEELAAEHHHHGHHHER